MKTVFDNQQFAAKHFGTLFAVIDLFYSYPNREKYFFRLFLGELKKISYLCTLKLYSK